MKIKLRAVVYWLLGTFAWYLAYICFALGVRGDDFLFMGWSWAWFLLSPWYVYFGARWLKDARMLWLAREIPYEEFLERELDKPLPRR